MSVACHKLIFRSIIRRPSFKSFYREILFRCSKFNYIFFFLSFAIEFCEQCPLLTQPNPIWRKSAQIPGPKVVSYVLLSVLFKTSLTSLCALSYNLAVPTKTFRPTTAPVQHSQPVRQRLLPKRSNLERPFTAPVHEEQDQDQPEETTEK